MFSKVGEQNDAAKFLRLRRCTDVVFFCTVDGFSIVSVESLYP